MAVVMFAVRATRECDVAFGDSRERTPAAYVRVWP